MRSTLETISGRFTHAVFATYSINLHFFEQWVLPLLRKAEVRNVIVLADHAQLGVALEDKSVRAVGRSYHATSVRVGPGAFHPKLMLLTGEGGTRLCVSSANLTVDGQLRNLEDAIVLDSTIDSHQSAIADAATFIRRLSEHTPAPTAEALLTALEPVTAASDGATVRFVHNLARPLIDVFPEGAFVAVTPFSDEGKAASALLERGPLKIVTDGEQFAAPAAFFAGGWTVEPRSFGTRRLHAKAYWTDSGDGGWLLLGSPNLSRQALLTTAEKANTEIGIVLAPHQPRLEEVPGSRWAGIDLAEAAPRRHTSHATSATTEASKASAFNAWEDDDGITLEGIPDNTAIEYWDGRSWQPLGLSLNGRLAFPEELRPYLIRAAADSGRWRQAIVHRPIQLLRQRLRQRTTSRAADVVSALPLDLEGVKVLEGVITDLYVLAELKDREGNALPAIAQPSTAPAEDTENGSLTDWMPAHPADEPRVPEIYRQSWQGEPDALLALIRSALRLDREQADEQALSEETLDLSDLEKEPEPLQPTTPAPPKIAKPALTRYRNALVNLLERGDEFVRRATNPDLADLGFQSVLRLHERLTILEVEVEDETQPLVPADVLRQHKLALLKAYLLEREGNDQQCLATARIHLADCLDNPNQWQPLDWESLEALAYATGPAILAANPFVTAAAEDVGIDPATATARLQPYAQRAQWFGFYDRADSVLDLIDIEDEPIPWVRGKEWFDELDLSPVWRLAGYAAIVSFGTATPYAVLVENLNGRSNHTAHLVGVDPQSHTLHEAWRRRTDGEWLARTYRTISRGDIDRMYKFGVEALGDLTRSPFRPLDPATAPDLLRPVLALLPH